MDTVKNESLGQTPKAPEVKKNEAAPKPKTKAPAPQGNKANKPSSKPKPKPQKPAVKTQVKRPMTFPQKKREEVSMDVYFKNYPENKVFYRTSDGQVFLEKHEHLAKNHQRRLKGGSVETIKRD
jgi:hypothetical protein